MLKEEYRPSASKVNKGIQRPAFAINETAKKIIQRKKSFLSLNEYVDGILVGNRITLSRAITLIESSLPKHTKLAQEIIEGCIHHSGNSIRLGITGVPGVGKSTFIESLGKYLTGNGRKVAVLAIDPSSEISLGSILADKTRMEKLSNDPQAFIRPSPSSGTLGGVARKTRESIILCEAAGFDTILVETVGVGQSETAVSIMVDFFLLLMLAGAGDELQGIKRGIMEMADAIVINKADNDNILKAETAKADYQNALHLFPVAPSGWIPRVTTCSSITNDGIKDVWRMILDYVDLTKRNEYFILKRREQAKFRMTEMINETLKNEFYRNPKVSKLLPAVEKELLSQNKSSYSAAQKLLDVYFKSLKKK
jgi:LAO/AO transport system kinase